MRLLSCLVLVCLGVCFAAAPPAKVPAEWDRLIEQLGEEGDARENAEKKLADLGEDVVPVLRRASKTHDDVDVRLRATVLAAAIEKTLYGEQRAITGHGDGVLVLAVSPDGKRVVSGAAHRGADTVARVWDVETGKELLQLKGHTGPVHGLAWSKDGKHILSGGGDSTVRVWDAKTGKSLQTINVGINVQFVALTPDGKKAISCGSERMVRVWDLESGKQTADNEDNTAAVRSVVVLPDGKRFVSLGFDGRVRLIDLGTGKLIRTMDVAHVPGGAWFGSASPDGKTLATSGGDKMVRLWDVETGKQLKEFSGHTEGVHAIAFSANGRRLISGGYDRTLRVWDVVSGEQVQRFDDAHEDVLTCVAALPDGRVITSGYDKTVKVWKIRR
jgi:WD40 repeat protein